MSISRTRPKSPRREIPEFFPGAVLMASESRKPAPGLALALLAGTQAGPAAGHHGGELAAPSLDFGSSALGRFRENPDLFFSPGEYLEDFRR